MAEPLEFEFNLHIPETAQPYWGSASLVAQAPPNPSVVARVAGLPMTKLAKWGGAQRGWGSMMLTELMKRSLLVGHGGASKGQGSCFAGHLFGDTQMILSRANPAQVSAYIF